MTGIKFAFALTVAFSSSVALAVSVTEGISEPVAAAVTTTLSEATTTDPASAVHNRMFQRAPDGLFYIHAAVNGTPLRFVIDTGASVVVLNRQDAARLGLSYESLSHSAQMKTVGGPSAMKWTEIKRLEMAGKRLEGISAAVVDKGLPVSLLGQNALSLLGTVTLKGDVLTID
ncbi:retropepsin-like aspartic protease family protein [Sphingobium sp. CR28]|uniref:retropepsin-like aspartic protease family protein n=1 Tax=Sphingobium sp. CR28 TaxID=3400272 RepID=UPI003FEF4B8F